MIPQYASRIGQACVAWAAKVLRWGPGLCQNFTRTAQGAPAGAATALDSWRAAGKEHQHAGKFPPPGVSACWRHPTRPEDPGHTAPSFGGGRVRSTDYPSRGRVGTVSIGAISREWGLEYLGWTDRTNGATTWIPPVAEIDGTRTRRALARSKGSVAVPHGRLLKREIGAVVGKGLMSYRTDKLGHSARAAARRLEASYHPDGNGVLSDADLRRLGFTRNAFRVHH